MMKVALDASERGSAAWQKVETYLTSRLTALRVKVENPDVPESERLGLCWRIREIKELLKLGDQPTEPQDDAGE